MGIILGLLLLFFWGGVVMLVLANLHIVLISPWVILIVWLIVLGLYSTGLYVFYKKSEEMLSDDKLRESLERADEAAEYRIAQMELEIEKRKKEKKSQSKKMNSEARAAFMYDDAD